MRKLDNATSMDERTVVKTTKNVSNGVEQINLSRYAIGYILKGDKIIQQGDKSTHITKGSIFFLGLGVHYIEDIPAENTSFEQIIFYYTPDSLQQSVVNLSTETLRKCIVDVAHSNTITATTISDNEPNKLLQNFFQGVNSHLENGGFNHNSESERLKLTELAHLILRYGDHAIQCAMMESLDCERADFERVIFSNILIDRTIGELAALAGRSVTSFKQLFKSLFGMPPHRWYLQQRLEYAQLLLSTTKEPIAQVGVLSAFPNTSHFIKLFKRQFGKTPAAYRQQYFCNPNNDDEISEIRAEQNMVAQM